MKTDGKTYAYMGGIPVKEYSDLTVYYYFPTEGYSDYREAYYDYTGQDMLEDHSKNLYSDKLFINEITSSKPELFFKTEPSAITYDYLAEVFGASPELEENYSMNGEPYGYVAVFEGESPEFPFKCSVLFQKEGDIYMTDMVTFSIENQYLTLE